MILGVWGPLGFYGGDAPPVTSTLTLSLTGIPDGDNTIRIFNPADSSIVFSGLISFTNNEATKELELPSGTTLEYYAISMTKGGVNRGVTE